MNALGETLPNPPPTAQEAPWPRPAYAWYVLGVLSLAYTFSIIDRMILALLIEPIRADLGVNDTQIALLGGFAFALFYTVLGLPIGRLSDRKSRRLIIAGGIFLWSLMTAACGLAKNFWQLFFARMGVGVGEATISPASYSLIADYYPPQKLSRALSVYSLGVHLGGGFAFIAGGAVVALLAGLPEFSLPFFGPLRPWQMTFVVVGLPGLLLVGLMATVREPLRRGLESRAGGRSDLPLSEVAAFIRRNRRTFVLLFCGFSLFAICAISILMWLPTMFIRTYGWSASEIGLAFGSVMIVCGGLGTITGGWWSDRRRAAGQKDAPVRITMYSALAIVPLGTAMPLAPGAAEALGLAALVIFLLGLTTGLAPTSLMLITPNQMRAQISALFLFVVNILGMGLGPLFVGLITDFVFADELALRYSLSLVIAFTAPLCAGTLFLALGPFRGSIETAKAWHP